MTLRVVLADDHMLMRQGLRSLIQEQPDMEVVAEAGDGRTVVDLAKTLKPDVVIMDVGMPELNGIEAARQITADVAGARVIGLSMHSSQQVVLEMLRAGAAGYVLKLSAFDEVVRAIKSVSAGNQYLSPEVASLVIDGVVRGRYSQDGTAFGVLTPREREILQLLAEGKSTKEAASSLGISPRTVDVHRKNIMDKLELYSVAELTRYAVRQGLVPLELT